MKKDQNKKSKIIRSDLNGGGKTITRLSDKYFSSLLSLGGGIGVVFRSAFAGYSEMAAVTMPHSLRSVCSEAFRDCAGLRKVAILTHPESVAENNRAF